MDCSTQKIEHEDQVKRIFLESYGRIVQNTDKLFSYLFVFEWILGIIFALTLSPRTWAGASSETHLHVYAAVILGGILTVFPMYLVIRKPGATVNRMTIAVSQILYSSLFIHLTGGRIETHFHVFGSLAFLAFYRDLRPILIATGITAFDHLFRGAFWPDSVYGVAVATPWRALEHAAWVLFEDLVLWYSMRLSLSELWSLSETQVKLQETLSGVEHLVSIKTAELHNTIRDLEISEEKFRSVSQSANDAIFSANQKSLILSWNRGAELIFGYKEAEILEQPLDLILPRKFKDFNRGGIFRLQLTDVNQLLGKTTELYGLRKDRIQIPVELSLASWNSKREVFYSGIIRNISERKLSESKIIEQNQALITASKMSALGEMAGGIAHEINNPLATIKSLCSQLQEVADDVPMNPSLIKEMAGDAEKTTNRIAKIVQGLRSFSRDGSHDPFQPINVLQLIDETLSFCSEKLKNHGVLIIVDTEILSDLKFEGRATEISQVLLNLLNNSYDALMSQDFSTTDSLRSGVLREKWIKISVLNLSDTIEILVTDSGCGIPIDLQEKIFKPFFTTKELGKGTGMGLSISTRIVQGHRGKLVIDSDCVNTRFVIRLPKRQTKANQFKLAS